MILSEIYKMYHVAEESNCRDKSKHKMTGFINR